MDHAAAGDYRMVWETNRHQLLVVLAQAYRFSGDKRYLVELLKLIRGWLRDNPLLRGINWTSALEAAFRALSWIWIYHLVGAEMHPAPRGRFLTELYRHGYFIERNLSIYFSPNTHLLGEAVVLHALGVFFPEWPRSVTWREIGRRLVEEQIRTQVHSDGSHFEHSTSYHVYALDFFLFHAVLAGMSDGYRERVTRMAEYLLAVSGPGKALPRIGDDDGGRVFHPFGTRDHFGRATLCTCGILLDRPDWICDEDEVYRQAAWWLGPDALGRGKRNGTPVWRSRRFMDAGVIVLSRADLHLVMDYGELGSGSGGHSHCDTLSLIASKRGEAVLIDPGTYTYAIPKWRDRFRGSAMHNTIRVDGRDQGVLGGAFGWREKPQSETTKCAFNGKRDFIIAECRYGGFTHRRRVLLVDADLLFVLDEIEGPGGTHWIEQFWHAGQEVHPETAGSYGIGSLCWLVLPAESTAELSEGELYGWNSPLYGSKAPAPVLCVHRTTTLPAYFATVFDFQGNRADAALQSAVTGDRWILRYGVEIEVGTGRDGGLVVRPEREVS
jgi:hypothetical protein